MATSQPWHAFAREVARHGRAWTVKDPGGVPAPLSPGGFRVVPFWSNEERVRRILARDPEFRGFQAVEVAWDEFRDRWLARCERETWLVGLNWAGDHALGFDADPKEVRAAVEAELEGHSVEGLLIAETPRLRLREWKQEDLGRVAPIYGDPGLTQWIGDGSPRDQAAWAAEIDRCRRLYRERGFGLWAVEIRENGALIGHCGLQDLDGGTEIALGYALASEWRGQGYALEAARAVVDYGFATLGIDRIVAVTQPSNVSSIKVLERLGMTFVHEAEHYGKRVAVYGMDSPGKGCC